MFKILFVVSLSLSFAIAAEESPRDKLVREAQRVEKAVLKDLGTLREKGCKLVKGKKCVPDEKPAPRKAN